MEPFFSRLSYSIGNEDWQTEQRALKIKPSDRILCITASGDRPLNLLLNECKEVVSIDANPFQNALCDLKRAAMSCLDYDQYLFFLGANKEKTNGRKELFNKLESLLERSSVQCWKKNEDKILKGILYQGTIEKWTNRASYCIRKLRGNKVEQLFSFNNIEEQKDFVEKQWNCKAWEKAFDICLNPIFPKFFLKDPGLYAHVDPSIRVSTHVYNRINYALTHFPASESLVVSLVIYGKILPKGFPPYLLPEYMEHIRERLNRLTIKQGNLIEYLEEGPEKKFDCFSMSDVASYMSSSDFNRLLRGMLRSATPGARFCIRQFLSRHQIPSELEPYFERDQALEQTLAREDRCFLYQFLVGTIKK